MAKSKGAPHAGAGAVKAVEERAGRIAVEMGLELVEVTLLRESRGKCLCVYVDRDGGLSLDDCEKYHKQLQPLLDDIDYDIMEVSSPGVDRPVKTLRDFEKKRGAVVEVRLFAPVDGAKAFRGTLEAMDGQSVTILEPDGGARCFERRGVAVIKPVIELEDDDFADVSFGDEE